MKTFVDRVVVTRALLFVQGHDRIRDGDFWSLSVGRSKSGVCELYILN